MKEADESAKSGFCLVLGDLHRFVGTRSGLSFMSLELEYAVVSILVKLKSKIQFG